MRLVLASASPRRAELLTSAGIPFDILAADIDESRRTGEPPSDYVVRVARDKAAATAASLDGHNAAILAADTIVVAGGRVLGKPADEVEAYEMLSLLSGVTHEVHTGVALMVQGRVLTDVAKTRVRFVPMSDEDIRWYISTGEPEGKAGAYAIQGKASRFVDWIEGSWSNVVGLPVASVHRLLRQTGVIS